MITYIDTQCLPFKSLHVTCLLKYDNAISILDRMTANVGHFLFSNIWWSICLIAMFIEIAVINGLLMLIPT